MAGQNNKLLLYLGSLAKGGAEHVAVNLAQYFNDQGWQVCILTKLKADEEYDIPVGVTRRLADLTETELSKSRVVNLHKRVSKLQSIFREIEPDIIVSFIGKNNFMAITAAKPLNIPVVVCVRSAPEREYKKKMMHLLVNPMFKKSAGIVLQTQEAMNFFRPEIREKSIILPNSVNPVFMKKRFCGQKRDTIITVGRLDDNKNQILLIRAFLLIAEEFPTFELILYGDGPSRTKWEKIVNESANRTRIHFKGLVSDVQDKINEDRIFVLPSIMEGMPNALIEAMALGLSVISTDCPCGGPRDLLGDNENGLLVPVEDANAMANAIREILLSPELEQKLQENAYRKAQELLPEKVNEKWKKYIQGVIEENKGR